MKTRREIKPTKFALIVFIGLIIFCLAQLSWWIIYQIDLSKQLSRHKVELLHQKIEIVSLTANRCFQQKSEMISYALSLAPDKNIFIDSLLADSTIIGYSATDRLTGEKTEFGRLDSSLYADIGGATVYFDPRYPKSLLGDDIGNIEFNLSGRSDGENMSWVRPEMFSISPNVKISIEQESSRRIKMFASEGSFFVPITLFGAFLIYRTLKRSEGLKFRQQNFIHAVTHEFRTPLTSLRLYLQTLQAGKLHDDKKPELYDKMLDDCYRLDGMVDNVLEAGHSVRNDYKLNLVKTDLSGDLSEYLDNFEPQVKGLNGQIERRIEPDIFVRTDYHALERAVKAIMENALKYSKPDNRVIRVALTREASHACITIADNGVGIPKNEQKYIFDRFYRIGNESTRNFKGTGLGLYLARQTVEGHGGKIEIQSEGIDRGSVFTIKLPVVS